MPPLTALSENTYMSAIRAGMVSVVPLTIIGGLFMIVAHLPIAGWETLVAPYLHASSSARDGHVWFAFGFRVLCHRL